MAKTMSKETILVALAGLFLGALFTAGLWILRPPQLPGTNPEIVKPAEIVIEKEIKATPGATIKTATTSASTATGSAKVATSSAKTATTSGTKR